MTFWILLSTAGFLTIMSLRYYNLILSFAASLGWIALWMYNLNYPPANIAVGTTLHEVLVYTFIIMAIATIYMYFRNRGRASIGAGGGNESGNRAELSGRAIRYSPPSLMEMSPEEYKAYIRSRVRRRRR